MFLKKDDPKVTSLMQQAELLSSLAQKVNADNTEQSMENAWKVNYSAVFTLIFNPVCSLHSENIARFFCELSGNISVVVVVVVPNGAGPAGFL